MPLYCCIGGCISVDVFCGVCTIYNTVYIIVLVKYIYVIIDKCNGRKKKRSIILTRNLIIIIQDSNIQMQ